MKATLRQRLWTGALVSVACLASWRLTVLAGQPPQKSAAVRMAPASQPVDGGPGKKGATYYALEGQTTRLTTSFVDGTKAVAERGFDGDLVTRLEDVSGNEINRFKVHRVDGVNDVLQYSPFGSAPVMAQPDPTVRQTLDWSNQQSHRLYQDRVLSGTRLEWKGGMMRKAGAAVTNDAEIERDVRAVETQFAHGYTARTVRIKTRPGTTHDGGKPVQGDILATTLWRDGVEVGHADYLTYERIFAWSMPGLSEGVITNEHLKQRYGGWRFIPDMVWMYLQAIGTFHWRSELKAHGPARSARRPESRNPLLQFFVPAVAATDEGCDNMHRLDGSGFRPCCDIHDACYYGASPGCTQTSWWHWGNWSCDWCNMQAFACFVGGGIHMPFVNFP
jgi:hypothetical protein